MQFRDICLSVSPVKILHTHRKRRDGRKERRRTVTVQVVSMAVTVQVVIMAVTVQVVIMAVTVQVVIRQ